MKTFILLLLIAQPSYVGNGLNHEIRRAAGPMTDCDLPCVFNQEYDNGRHRVAY